MSFFQSLAKATRPLRRATTPRQFKETYINEFLQRDISNATYLEIGVQAGESFRSVTAARKIGVDPVRHPALAALKEGESFFECASDDFFSREAPTALAQRSLDVALVDGLHEFRQALRDVLHLEPYMREDGLIVIDDCNPGTEAQARDSYQRGSWNGDVWKVILYLRRERNDLHVLTIDADQGIGLVWGFGRGAAEPAGSPETYKDLSYDVLKSNRRDVLGLVKPGRLGSILSKIES